MSNRTYRATIDKQPVELRLRAAPRDNADDVFQPNSGEKLTLLSGGKEFEYGTQGFIQEAVRLRLPEFNSLNLKIWSETLQPDLPSARASIPVGTYYYEWGEGSGTSTLIVEEGGCIVTGMNNITRTERLIDLGCDGVTEYVNGREVDHDPGNLLSSRVTGMFDIVELPRRQLEQREQVRKDSEGWRGQLRGQREAEAKRRKPELEARLKQSQAKGTETQVYFDTGSATLSAAGKGRLDALIKKNKGATSWLLEGFCDNRGSLESNYELGQRRAEAVATYIKGRLTRQGGDVPKVSFSTVSYGETRSGGAVSPRDRRVNVLPGADAITKALLAAKGDKSSKATPTFYLLDASGSMQEAGYVDKVVYFPYPQGSQFYQFPPCEAEGPLEKIDHPYEYQVCGGTPLWQSLLLIDQVPEGTRITLLTDGYASPRIDVGGQSVDGPTEAAKRARAKGIQISMINIGGVATTAEAMTLVKVAVETGGRYYIVHPRS